MGKAARAAGVFRVGDRVLVPTHRPIVGDVIEDRGPLGRNGRNMYSVRIPMDPEPMIVEIPGDELQPAPGSPPELDTQKIVEYFKGNGLIAVFRSEIAAGRDRPRVWLRLDGLGSVIYSFDPGPGFRGGVPIPVKPLYRNRIFTPNKDEVASFLEAFGLDRSQADEVISAVGTAP